MAKSAGRTRYRPSAAGLVRKVDALGMVVALARMGDPEAIARLKALEQRVNDYHADRYEHPSMLDEDGRLSVMAYY